MSYVINPAEQDRCVFLTYEGEITADEAVAARSKVKAVLVAKEWHRVVVDATGWRSVPTASELFHFANELSSVFSLKVRIALVIRPDQAKHARLVEKLARNDTVFLTYFLDAQKATAWVQGTLPRLGIEIWHGADINEPAATSSGERQVVSPQWSKRETAQIIG